MVPWICNLGVCALAGTLDAKQSRDAIKLNFKDLFLFNMQNSPQDILPLLPDQKKTKPLRCEAIAATAFTPFLNQWDVGVKKKGWANCRLNYTGRTHQ